MARRRTVKFQRAETRDYTEEREEMEGGNGIEDKKQKQKKKGKKKEKKRGGRKNKIIK